MSNLQHISRPIVVLGTGGTIAGTAAAAQDNVGYRAAQLGVEALVAALPELAAVPLRCEQVAQVDSKDLDIPVWQALASATQRHLETPGAGAPAGVVVTHGTDTLEETAWLLQRVLAPARPVVLTAAMRPATSRQADGPQNLLDAIALAADPAARGVLVCAGGDVWAARGVRKLHSYRLAAFGAGDTGPVARVEEGRVRWLAALPLAGPALGLERLQRPPADWPRVEIVMNHAAADGRIVELLVAHGVDGIVVAGTGNGTLSTRLAAALDAARAAGVRVRVTTRCAAGPVIGTDGADEWTAPQARVELLLELLGRRKGADEG